MSALMHDTEHVYMSNSQDDNQSFSFTATLGKHESLFVITETYRYLVLACFSVNTLRRKCALLLGSKVEGMMTYSPGGRLKRPVTSRVFMKALDKATAFCGSRISGPR